MKKELIIKNTLNQKVYAVRDNDGLKGFIVENATIKEMVAYLMLRKLLSEDHAERNCCHMILTLFDVLPVREG